MQTSVEHHEPVRLRGTMSEHVLGMSGSSNNDELFDRRQLKSINWISASRQDNIMTIVLLPLAKRPKKEGEQFAPTFTTDEILQIASAQLPRPSECQNADVYIDGIVPVAIALRMSNICRFARSIHVNVPREGGWKKVGERLPVFGEFVLGDYVRCRIFGNEVKAKVMAVSDTGIQVAEMDRRRGQRVWLNEASDVMGWSN